MQRIARKVFVLGIIALGVFSHQVISDQQPIEALLRLEVTESHCGNLSVTGLQ